MRPDLTRVPEFYHNYIKQVPENAIVENPVSNADRGLAVFERVPGQSKARAKEILLVIADAKLLADGGQRLDDTVHELIRCGLAIHFVPAVAEFRHHSLDRRVVLWAPGFILGSDLRKRDCQRRGEKQRS